MPAYQIRADLRAHIDPATTYEDIERLMRRGAVEGKDAEFDVAHFLPEAGDREVVCHALHQIGCDTLAQVSESLLGVMRGACANASLVDLLTVHARYSRIHGLTRLVAAERLWTHPTAPSLVYAPALYFFPGRNYLGLHRLDERWLPEYGVLVKSL